MKIQISVTAQATGKELFNQSVVMSREDFNPDLVFGGVERIDNMLADWLGMDVCAVDFQQCWLDQTYLTAVAFQYGLNTGTIVIGQGLGTEHTVNNILVNFHLEVQP